MQPREKVSMAGGGRARSLMFGDVCLPLQPAKVACVVPFLFSLHVCHIGSIINARATATAAANYANQTNASLEPTVGPFLVPHVPFLVSASFPKVTLTLFGFGHK